MSMQDDEVNIAATQGITLETERSLHPYARCLVCRGRGLLYPLPGDYSDVDERDMPSTRKCPNCCGRGFTYSKEGREILRFLAAAEEFGWTGEEPGIILSNETYPDLYEARFR